MIRLAPFHIYLLALLAGVTLRAGLLLVAHDYFSHVTTEDIWRGLILGLSVDSIFLGSIFFLTQTVSEILRFFRRDKAVRNYLNFLMLGAVSFFIVCGLFDLLFFRFLQSKIRIPLIINNLDQLGPIAGTLTASLSLVQYGAIFLMIALIVMAIRSVRRLPKPVVKIEPSPSVFARFAGILFLFAASFLWLKEPIWRTELVAKQSAVAMTIGNSGLYSAGMDGMSILLKKKKQNRLMEAAKARELFSSHFLRHPEPSPDASGLLTAAPSGRPPNIVVILMEYMGAFLSRRLTPDGLNSTSNLDRIAAGSVSFTHGLAASSRTNHGFVSVLSGFPSVLGVSVIRARNGLKIPTLASALPDYDSTFLYSGDIGFDYMDSFAAQGDFKHLIGDKELLEQNPDWQGSRSQWGFPDSLFLGFLHRYLVKNHDRGKPILAVALTTSNHEPFQLPEAFHEQHPDLKRDSIEAAATYADQSIGEFFELAKKEKYYENTIFVFVADHSRIRSPDEELLKGFHIPIIIHSKHIEPREIDAIANQVDIPATVMGMLGRSFPAFNRFGRNLLQNPPGRPSSGMSRDGDYYVYAEGGYSIQLNLVTGNYQLAKYDRYARATLIKRPQPYDLQKAEHLLETSKAYFQTVSDVMFGVTQ